MTGGTGIVSTLLDILPPAALAGLAAFFLRGRSRCRREERDLKHTIDLFSQQEPEKRGEEDDINE